MPTSSNKRQVQRTNRFGRDLKRLPEAVQREAFATAIMLADDIFDGSLKVRPLTGFKGLYRVVVIRDYRLIFSFDDANLYLLRIGHRREIYRNLEI